MCHIINTRLCCWGFRKIGCIINHVKMEMDVVGYMLQRLDFHHGNLESILPKICTIYQRKIEKIYK